MVLMHGFGHPATGHIEKLIAKQGVFVQAGKSHAFARVLYAFRIFGVHDGAPLDRLPGGSADLSLSHRRLTECRSR